MGLDSSLGELSGMLRGLSYGDLNGGCHRAPVAPAAACDGDGGEDCEIISDVSLSYIRHMLEEDIDEKVSMYQAEYEALRATAKPFYDILGHEFPPPEPSSTVTSDSGGSALAAQSPSSAGTPASGSSDIVWACDAASDQSVRSSPGYSAGEADNDEPLIMLGRVPESLMESFPAWSLRRGAEEAPRREAVSAARVRKNPQREQELDLMEGRSLKQSAPSSDEPLRTEMFDMLSQLPVAKKASDLRKMMRMEATRAALNGQAAAAAEAAAKGPPPPGGKTRGRKPVKRDVVDLRTLLMHCAQAVSADDRRTATELLRQIRQHSSVNGDGSQRLAHWFADGLEARLAGTGSQEYQKLVAKRTSASDMLKAYHLYLAACPFKRLSHFFSNQTILNVAAGADRVHIIDFGIYFGFQWPCLIKRLANHGGDGPPPPKLRITGIDVPQPGFRPTERIEETGQRLAEYAKKFGVPFEYRGIAGKWETIRVEDLDLRDGEVVIVNCLYRFRNLIDETVAVDSPRNRVLNTIREVRPAVFVHGVVNGSYSVPFFITRFREALFHFSAVFDMLEATVPRNDDDRLLIERDLFGREALNVIACEGSDRVERPETYKQWQVRNLRAGFAQLPLDADIVRKAKEKVREMYHKDFVVDEDTGWLLQGWKGRIVYAVSTWKPSSS